MFRKVLPYAHPPSPSKYLEEEKEDNTPQANIPPYLERLETQKTHTLEEVELVGVKKYVCKNTSHPSHPGCSHF